jgi:glycerophosphoryl diester phosphodiesterase
MLVFGHRGACGYLPENTMASLELAFEQGADAIEFDVVMTKDSHPVILHDNDLSHTTNIAVHNFLSNKVEDLNLEDIRALRVIERYPDSRIQSALLSGKYPVPTLEEVLANPGFDGKHLIIEIKHGKHFADLGLDIVTAVAQNLAASNWISRGMKITLESFEFAVLQSLKTQIGAPANYVFLTAPDMLPKGRPLLEEDLLSEIAENFDGVSVAISQLFTSPVVEIAKRLGLLVYTYTARVETTEGSVDAWFETLIASGVDGIFADQPDQLLQVVSRLT